MNDPVRRWLSLLLLAPRLFAGTGTGQPQELPEGLTAATRATAVKMLEPGSEPRRLLRHTIAPGAVETLVTTWRVNSSYTLMLPQDPPDPKKPSDTPPVQRGIAFHNPPTAMTLVQEITPGAAGVNGDIPYKVKYVRGAEEKTVFAGFRKNVASDDPGDKSSNSGEGVMDAGGYIKSEKWEKAEADAADSSEARLDDIFSFTTPLPEVPVGIGARWEIAGTGRVSAMRFRFTHTYTLLEFDGERGMIGVTQSISIDVQDLGFPGASRDARTELVKMESSGSGTLRFELGRLVNPKADINAIFIAEGRVVEKEKSHPFFIRFAFDMQRTGRSGAADQAAESGPCEGRGPCKRRCNGGDSGSCLQLAILAAAQRDAGGTREFNNKACAAGSARLCFILGLKADDAAPPDPEAAVGLYAQACGRKDRYGCAAVSAHAAKAPVREHLKRSLKDEWFAEGTVPSPPGHAEGEPGDAPPVYGPPSPGTPLHEYDLSETLERILSVDPLYPEEARLLGIQGSVFGELVIDGTGRVIAVRIVRSEHPALNEAAVTAFSQWRYKPPLREGRPVAVYKTVMVRFRLQ